MFSMAANILAFDLYFGNPGLIAAIGVFTLPAVIIIRGARWKRPIHQQLKMSLFAGFIGVAAALVGIRIYVGKDLIDVFTELMGVYLQQVPPQFLDNVLVRMFNPDLIPAGMETKALTEAILTEAQRAEYLDAFIAQMNNTLALTLPGTLLSSSAVTSVLGVHMVNWMLRRQPDRKMCHVPLIHWFTPWQVSLGLIGTLVFAMILEEAGMHGADTMYMAIMSLLNTAFIMQAVISINRHMALMGKRPWMRVLFILIMIIFVPSGAALYGSISALFGMHGAFRQLRARRRRKSGNDDI